ncbi:MAG: hypothetical protein L0H31_09300 [Nocardioidaceae bacterium]|nr:hypothetical protein [Nocardioidaceae bacterium]
MRFGSFAFGQSTPPSDLTRVAQGERLLAWAVVPHPAPGAAATIGGTRDALYLPRRLAWEQVASAEWDQDESTLRVVEVGEFGQRRAVHVIRLSEADRLLQLVRERVTASIAVQRHVEVAPRKSVRVLARQAPARRGDLAWFVEYDEGVDPADPEVATIVEGALASARADVGQ